MWIVTKPLVEEVADPSIKSGGTGRGKPERNFASVHVVPSAEIYLAACCSRMTDISIQAPLSRREIVAHSISLVSLASNQQWLSVYLSLLQH